MRNYGIKEMVLSNTNEPVDYRTLFDTIQKAEIRDALLSPEQVVDLAELEVEEFVAALGLALAVIPEAGSVIRGAYRAGAVAIEEGALMAGVRFVAAVRRAAVEGMLKTLEEGFAKVLAKELSRSRSSIRSFRTCSPR